MSNRSLDDLLDDEEPEPAKKRGRGRPPGVKNKPKETLITEQQLRVTFNRIKPHLTKELLEYFEGTINGTVDLSVENELTMLIRQVSILFARQIADALESESGGNAMNIAKLTDAYRAAIADLHKVKKENAEAASKETEEERRIDVTQPRPLAVDLGLA